jgi:hypothetical protein
MLMSVSGCVAHKVKFLPKGRAFGIEVFYKFGSRNAVYKALSRLERQGELERVYRGVYMRPKVSHYVENVRPSLISIVRIIANKNRETLQIHGAEAARRLGLSTQMQIIPTYQTSGPSRYILIGNAKVRLLHTSPAKLQQTGTISGIALTALFYIGKQQAVPKIVETIKKQLAPADLDRLMKCRLPKWMRLALDI